VAGIPSIKASLTDAGLARGEQRVGPVTIGGLTLGGSENTKMITLAIVAVALVVILGATKKGKK